MKKIWFSFAFTAVLVSCTQTEMKQTTDTIKQADSLFTTAKNGYKTLDSISKIVKDSAKFNKIVVPEIEKTKKEVENVIQNNAKSLDSINAVIKKTTDQLNKSANVIKTVDSAGKVLKETKNPVDILTTITKTIDKVSKQTKTGAKTETTTSPQLPQTADNDDIVIHTEPKRDPVPETAAPAITNPIVRTAQMKIGVNNVEDTRSKLATELYKYGGEIVTESFGEEQGQRNQFITAKVPYQYFEEATQNIAREFGTLRTKSVQSQGSEYDPNQMCDLEITFVENDQFPANETITNSSESGKPADTYGEKSSDAFMKGFTGMKNVFLFLLPFWPVLLIGGLIWYFAARSKRRKLETELERQRLYNEQLKNQNNQRAQNYQQKQYQRPENLIQDEEKNPRDIDEDYSRYMPKK